MNTASTVTLMASIRYPEPTAKQLPKTERGMSIRKASLQIILASTLALVLSNITVSDEPKDLEDTDLETLTELAVKLTDDDGKPVVGAAVMAYAMRMQEGGGHGFWNEEKLGVPKSVFSDERGVALVKYPANVYFAPQKMTTSLVTFSVKHADYVSKTVHHNLGPAGADVTLKKGCEIQLSAVDETGDPITGFAVLVAGPIAPEIWADDENGGRRTGGASDGTWQTMLVKPQDDSVTLFSSVLPLRVRPSQAVKIRNIRMTPGTRLIGTLSDNVPRPVKNGYVVTTTVPKPAGNSWDKEDPSLSWMQWEQIAGDGSFELSSIPQGGEIQVIALCDGWLSKSTVPEQKFFMMGQLFPTEEDEVEVTVEMERTGTIELTITDPGGRPLNDGTVSSWPNQKYYKGGSALLGMRYNTLELVKNQLAPPDQQTNPYSRDYSRLPFSGQPVNDGKAILTGMPMGRTNSLILQHSDYTFDAPNMRLGRGEVPVTVNSHETKSIEIKTKPVKQNAD